MSSCVLPAPSAAAMRSLKRARPSLGDEAELATAKVGKPWTGSSPRACMESAVSWSAAAPTSSARPSTRPSADSASASSACWPDVRGCSGVRKALAFLHTSRRHAVLLMVQNQWERAMGVLEKVEAAAESVSLQRRRGVIDRANAARRLALLAGLETLELRPAAGPDAAPTTATKPRAVRFSERVRVRVADEMDRAGDAGDAPPRAEMLVLRASRTLPQQNLSEFWDE